jgi:8-hydroxy-5-deazaflavin:NADPH oxidoreductase
VAEAAASGEVIVLATHLPSTEAAIREAGPGLRNKVVIDCMTPLKADLSWLGIGTHDSGGEQVARWAFGASVFNAMNQSGAENMRMGTLKGRKPVMFVCGDDETRKPVVLELKAEMRAIAANSNPGPLEPHVTEPRPNGTEH